MGAFSKKKGSNIIKTKSDTKMNIFLNYKVHPHQTTKNYRYYKPEKHYKKFLKSIKELNTFINQLI